MNDHVIAELAEIRRQELIADATIYRHGHPRRTRTSARLHNHPRRSVTALYAWMARGQL